MKSVGEAMAIGRTFQEAFQKALRSLETGRFGFGLDAKEAAAGPARRRRAAPRARGARARARVPAAHRAPARLDGGAHRGAHRHRPVVPRRAARPARDRGRAARLRDAHRGLRRRAARREAARLLRPPARPHLRRCPSARSARDRVRRGIRPVYKLVDTCAAEFEAATPYYYSTYEEEDELRPAKKPRIVILGGGPNRIGQGVEFDYCCVQAAYALRDAGYETVMVNSNPETVSTDYDTSDVLFFEPLTAEHVLDLCERLDAEGRDRAVRRADAAQPVEGARGRQGADHRDEPRLDRHGGRPRPLQGAARAARPAPARERHGRQRRRGRRRRAARSATRCSCGRRTCSAGAPWRSCYDDEQARKLHGDRRRGLARHADPRRQVPRGRDRGRRRRGRRRAPAASSAA